MVGAVKKWQKDEPEKSRLVWNKLSEANSSLEKHLCTLSKLAEESWDVYKSVIANCSINTSEKVINHLILVLRILDYTYFVQLSLHNLTSGA